VSVGSKIFWVIERRIQVMNPAGWVVMLLSVGSVLLLSGFCLYRVLKLPPVEVEEHLKGQLDIETGDRADAD